ncbi:MAG: polysaccharide biosynthesis C-terminal domain-containing protein [Saprospiraceae bacterium]|nr:polysaccharide biosynthesis C-terminal domain-containing protein [Saprospiraceae bacterium]
MGIIYKQAARGTIYSYIGVGLGFITTALLLPQLYSTEEVGLLKILLAYSILFIQFASLGLNTVTIRLFTFFRDNEKKHNGYLFIILIVSLIGFLLSLAVFYIIKPILIKDSLEKSALFVEYINYLIPLIFFPLFFSILDTYYSVLFNSVRGTFLKEVVQRIIIIVAIILYFFNVFNFEQFLISYVVSICLPTIFIIISLIGEKQFNIKPNLKFVTNTLAYSMMSVGLFGILNNFTSVIIFNIDSIMVNSMIGLDSTGVYSIAFFFGALIKIPSRPLIKISNVVIADSWKNNDLKSISDIYYKSCINQLILGLLLLVGIWGNIDNVLRILPSEYEAGKYVILFIALGNLTDMLSGVNSSVLGTSKYYKVQTLFMIFLMVIVVVTNYLFIPIWGITGAAIASALSLFLFNLIKYFFLLIKFKMQPFNYRYIIIIVIGFISYIAVYFLPEYNNVYFDIFVRSSIITIVFCLPVYLLKYSVDINGKVDEILIKFGIKK